MNISFSKLGKHGRLGNSLFQICSLIGLAKKHNATASFPDWCYEKYFEKPLPKGKMESIQLKEAYFHHHNWSINESSDIVAYLQSEKYWENAIPEIMEQLRFKKDFKSKVEKKYAHFFKKQTIAISIRRGDFNLNSNYAQLPITYYFTALEKYFPTWKENSSVIVFSDDIEYCKLHFHNYQNVFYAESDPKFIKKENYFKENYSAIEQLCLMTMCTDFIISNSTFSWFGAYLGETSKSKIIHHPEVFAGNLKKVNDTKDYYLTRWTIHE